MMCCKKYQHRKKKIDKEFELYNEVTEKLYREIDILEMAKVNRLTKFLGQIYLRKY